MRLFHGSVVLLFVAFISQAVQAQTAMEDLRQEVAALRKQLNSQAKADPIGKVDAGTAAKYASASNPVTTKAGKLNVSGLLQIWNYSIENDRKDVFGTGTSAAATTTATASAAPKSSSPWTSMKTSPAS